MADIQVASKNGKRKTAVPRIDLTPMVDLGFLLITFFMFTTTMAKARSIELNMPSTEKTNRPTAYVAESTLTIIAADHHLYYYYEGLPDNTHNLKRVGVQGLRNVIITKKMDAYRLPPAFSVEAHKLNVLLKPTQTCRYDDVVALLDEMTINAVPYYAMCDLTTYEQQWLSTLK
ncbi:MAG: biopolymer transporter ExbD [Flavipsychrobacter sp.]|nr:biopolymer transporter ExbD [Flavipsychrobacter sp.]